MANVPVALSGRETGTGAAYGTPGGDKSATGMCRFTKTASSARTPPSVPSLTFRCPVVEPRFVDGKQARAE